MNAVPLSLINSIDRFRGCLLAGAIGDALGAPIEAMSLAQIRERFGPAGLRTFARAYGGNGAITDDTQMTLFTAEGLIRAKNRMLDRGTTMPLTLLHRAYLRWLVTQGERPRTSGFGYALGTDDDLSPGWLSRLPALRSRRAPGNTCLTALQAECGGTVESPLNRSKGCGGFMRVAPIGLAFAEEPAFAFELAVGAAAITHGHPSGYLSAGAFAMMISRIVARRGLRAAVDDALGELAKHTGNAETSAALKKAVWLADVSSPSAETIKQLGGGWVGEEALAIGVYAALSTASIEDALFLAVNHSGDSDSTGAIAGNLVGAMYGVSEIPQDLLVRLELQREITQVANDLWRHFRDPTFEPSSDDFVRYPPN